ncbi:MAG: hypothetical protein GTO02_17015 [Candidatus Dadabacteria bacterium]|nr:hypothetical protein [Candidatus Dadabacteria bacterium]NIQ16028.1 hypothetical protein [Candidatus Dadabacteria bacterium]
MRLIKKQFQLNQFTMQYVAAYKNEDAEVLESLLLSDAYENGVPVSSAIVKYNSNFSNMEIINYYIKINKAEIKKDIGFVDSDFIITFGNLNKRHNNFIR